MLLFCDCFLQQQSHVSNSDRHTLFVFETVILVHVYEQDNIRRVSFTSYRPTDSNQPHCTLQCAHKHTQTHTHTHTHTHLPIHLYMYVHIYVCIYTYTHTYIQTYIRACAHTYISTYIHIFPPKRE